jgi:hypothetical protein
MFQRLPAPRTSRDLFELFATYQDALGIDAMLEPLDFTGMDRATVLTTLLGPVPAQRLEQQSPPNHSPAVHVRNLLYSTEFRERARPLILRTFAEKRRAIFIHIPKCAGTDMSTTLRRRYPTLQHVDFMTEGVPPEARFQLLREFVLGLRYVDTIVATGHERLNYYQKHRLIRPQDWVFTILRDGPAQIYSYVSYVITVCRTAPVTRRPDGLSWLAHFGLTHLPEDASADYLAGFGRLVLRDSRLTLPNLASDFLGGGSANSALARIAESNIEITDTQRYPAWRQANFPGAAETRENVSEPYFTPATATPADRDYIESITAEDRKLYRLVSKRLAATGALSLRGRELT